MGRWAQRRRAGGGINTPTQITHADITGTDTVEVYYSGPVTAANFSEFDFEFLPAGFFPIAVNQLAANALELSTGPDVSTQTTLAWTGNVANVLSPQTVGLTPL